MRVTKGGGAPPALTTRWGSRAVAVAGVAAVRGAADAVTLGTVAVFVTACNSRGGGCFGCKVEQLSCFADFTMP